MRPRRLAGIGRHEEQACLPGAWRAPGRDRRRTSRRFQLRCRPQRPRRRARADPGAGAYLTPHLRGDLTLDFLTSQDIDASATYFDAGPIINGLVTDRVRANRVVGLVNLYWDVLPRGAITPYIGAGVGFVYNDLNRTHLTTDDTPATLKAGSSKETSVSLAAALMAGASFSLNHQW